MHDSLNIIYLQIYHYTNIYSYKRSHTLNPERSSDPWERFPACRCEKGLGICVDSVCRAREEKIAEIRELKEHYDTGYWNANSVLLGGLGKYPHITGTYTL